MTRKTQLRKTFPFFSSIGQLQSAQRKENLKRKRDRASKNIFLLCFYSHPKINHNFVEYLSRAKLFILAFLVKFPFSFPKNSLLLIFFFLPLLFLSSVFQIHAFHSLSFHCSQFMAENYF